MSADVLRRAAALMRERAESAWPSEKWERSRYANDDPACFRLMRHELVAVKVYCGEPENAHHIASWHPAVALAVADWLEEAADHLEVGEESDELPSHICPTALEGLECSVLGQALKVATAYLGDPA